MRQLFSNMLQKYTLRPSIFLSSKKGIRCDYNRWWMETQVQQRLHIRLAICHLDDAFLRKRTYTMVIKSHLHYDDASSTAIHCPPSASEIGIGLGDVERTCCDSYLSSDTFYIVKIMLLILYDFLTAAFADGHNERTQCSRRGSRPARSRTRCRRS